MSNALDSNSYAPSDNLGLTDGTEGDSLFSSMVDYEGLSSLNQGSLPENLIVDDGKGNKYLEIPQKIAGFLDTTFSLPPETVETNDAEPRSLDNLVESMTGQTFEDKNWQQPAQVVPPYEEIRRNVVDGATQVSKDVVERVQSGLGNVTNSISPIIDNFLGRSNIQPVETQKTPETQDNRRNVLGNILGTGITGNVQEANVLAPAIAVPAVVVGTAKLAGAVAPFIPRAAAVIPVFGQVGAITYTVGKAADEFIHKPISNAWIANDSKKMTEDANQRLREQYRDSPWIAEAVINQDPAKGVRVSDGRVPTSSLIDAAKTSAENSVVAAERVVVRSATFEAASNAALGGLEAPLATAIDPNGDIWFGNRERIGAAKPNDTEVKPYRPAAEWPDLKDVKFPAPPKNGESSSDSSRPSSSTNFTNLSDDLKIHLEGFDPSKLILNFGNSKLNLTDSSSTDSKDSNKAPKNEKRPEDGEPPRMVDTNLGAGNGKRQTEFGNTLRASVGIGDIGDSKPQFPIGVDPEKNIQIGEPSDDQKIGDPRPEKLDPTVLPVLPDEQKVIVSKINNDVKNLPSNVDLNDLSGTSRDKPPAVQGDPKKEVTPLAELLKKNSTFGDPALDRPVVPIGDILKGAGGVRGSNDFDESLRYLTNGVGYDEAKLANEIRKHPMFPFIYEGLSDAEKSELERLDVKKPALDKYSPHFDIQMSSGTSGDELDYARQNGIPGAESYVVKSNFLGLNRRVFYFDENDQPIGEPVAVKEIENWQSARDSEQGSTNDTNFSHSVPADAKKIGGGAEGTVLDNGDGTVTKRGTRVDPNEVDMLRALRDRGVNVPRVHDSGYDSEGRYNIRMDKLDGSTLNEWLESASVNDVRIMQRKIDDQLARMGNLYTGDPACSENIMVVGNEPYVIDVSHGGRDASEARAERKAWFDLMDAEIRRKKS